MQFPSLQHPSRVHALIASALVIFLIALTLIIATGGSAGANDDNEPCVPKDAWTEVIEHAEEFHFETIVVMPEVPAVAEIWANWSPDRQQGPFTGPPLFPEDPRGTWHIHDKIPGGHEGPDGVYQRDRGGNGRGDWFYRLNGQDAIPAVTEEVKVVDQEAWTETIEHPAVVCETPTETPSVPTETPTVVTETPSVPTETPTVVTETPTTVIETPTVVTETPEVQTETETPSEEPTPTDEPKEKKDDPKSSSTLEACVDGVWTKTRDGVVVSESGTCGEDTVPVKSSSIKEEGL